MLDTRLPRELADALFERLLHMTIRIARHNSDFVCTDCIQTLDDLAAIASAFCGSDYARYIDDAISKEMEE